MISLFCRLSSDEGYKGFFVDWIEEWSQFFVPCNWRTFHPAWLEFEDDAVMGGVEMTLVVMGLGFRLRWNYSVTKQAADVIRQVEQIKAGEADVVPSCGCVLCDVGRPTIESGGALWHASATHPPLLCTRRTDGQP